jgi:starch-binding outer membrane protein, SusD/RagB family
MKAILIKHKILKIFALLLALSFGCSKDYLNYDERGVQTVATFYKTDAQTLEALNAIFDRWQQGISFNYIYSYDALSDECYAGGGARGDNGGALEELNEYRFSPASTGIRSLYSWYYFCVYRSNILIDNVKPDTDNKKIFVAMAKALRGYAYLLMVNTWGDVPLVLHELAASENSQPRTPLADVYAQIEKDLTEAIADLPERSAMPAAYTHLICKGTAEAMLGKTYLYEKKYDEAASTFQKIIDSNEYSLYPDYTKILRRNSEYGVESLWEVAFVTTMGYNNPYGSESGLAIMGIMMTPRPEYLKINVYGALGIFPFGWGFINPHKEMYDAFTNAGDIVRRDVNLLSPSALAALGGKYETPAGFTPYGSDGYIRLKYIPFVSEGSGGDDYTKFCNTGTNVRMIRYADVLLMAAEAYNRKSSPDDVKARTYINLVRNRVSLAPVATSGDALFADIKLERKLELAFEGQRYFDLQRWGDAYAALKDQGKAVPNGAGGFWNPDGAGYKQNKNEFLPFPEYEMTVNIALKGHQNPGY